MTAISPKELEQSPSHLGVPLLCMGVALLDGYDTQAMAYAAPTIVEEWSIEPAAMGPVFSAVLLGLMIGATFLGGLADRIGRKPVICAATILFGLFSLATVTANSLEEIAVWRFLTGLGLGAALPNIIALTAEHAPPHRRSFAVSSMFCGFPLGSIIGGFAAPTILETSGWQGIFLIGGLLPLVLFPVLVFFLRESPELPEPPPANLGRKIAGGRSLGRLWAPAYRRDTMLLSFAFFASLLVMYFLVNWLPTLFRDAGLSLANAIQTTVILNIGGILGALVLAQAVDRFGALRILPFSYALAALAIALIGLVQPGSNIMSALIFVAGMGVVGGQIGCNALAADRYPPSLRGAGVGWALGIGRLGSIIGPLAGGALVAVGASLGLIFLIIALSAAFASVALSALKDAET